MGRKVWTRETLTSADLQEYLQDQTVLQYPSAAARDLDIPTASRTDGMVTWLTDVNRAEWWDAPASKWRTAWGEAVPDTEVTYGSGWARYSDVTIGWAGLRFWKIGETVTISGAFQTTAATTVQSVLAQLPAAIVPPRPIQGPPGYHVRPTGLLVSSNARAAGFVDSIGFSYSML